MSSKSWTVGPKKRSENTETLKVMSGLNPPDPRKLFDQATRLARCGELDKAVALATQLPPSAVKYQFLIDLLTNRRQPGDRQEAEKICALWQGSAPGSVQPLFQLMQLYWSSGRHKLIPPFARKIGELEPNHQFTAHYQAISKQLNGDFRGACAKHIVTN